MSSEEIIARIRGALAVPSEKNWRTLLRIFEQIDVKSESFAFALAYAKEHLASWDEATDRLFAMSLRRAPDRWLRAMVRGETPPAAWSLVRYLALDHKDASGWQVSMLAVRPSLCHLTQLGLLDLRDVEPDLLEQIADAPSLDSLTSLLYWKCRANDSGVARLVGRERAARWRSLRLSTNEITDAGIAAIVGSSYLEQLSLLGLSYNPGITEEGVRALALAENLPALQRLDLSYLDTDSRMHKRGWDAYENIFPKGHLRRALFRSLLLECNVAELKKMCKPLGLRGYSKWKREELLLQLERHHPELKDE